MDKMDSSIQEGYGVFEAKKNGQEWTKMDKMDSSIQEGYELSLK